MPKLLTTPFASEATSEYRTDVQNATGVEPNSATYEQGFPPLTMEKIANGGKPPKGSDLNGVLYDITDNIVSLTKGARYGFNEAYATAIGGYPLGAVLRLDNGVEVESEVDSNSINPNVDMTGWKLAISDKGVLTSSGKNLREFNDIAFKNVIYPEMFGSVDSQGYADNMFNTMINSLNTLLLASCVVELRNDYKFKTTLNTVLRGNLTFSGNGSNTIDISQTPITTRGYVFNFYGAGKGYKTTVSTNKDLQLLDKTIDVVDASGLSVGDWISITSNGEYWNGIDGASGYNIYYKGELSRVKSISGNTITLMLPLQDSYLTSEYSVNVCKISMIDNIEFSDFNVIGHGVNNYTSGIDTSKVTVFCNLECTTKVKFTNVKFREVITNCVFHNVGWNHCFINCDLTNSKTVSSTSIGSSATRLGIMSAPYGVSEVKYINCNTTSARRLMNVDQSKYAWVNSTNQRESIHSFGVFVLGGNSYELYNAVGGHQYKNMQVIGHNAIGCLSGIQHRGKDLIVSNCNLETTQTGIVLGIGTTTAPSSYTEDPTCGNVIIDGSTRIRSKVRGIWATQSWDSLVCEASIEAPSCFIAEGKRQSDAFIIPKFNGNNTGSAIQLLNETGLISRENFYVKGGYIHNVARLATIYGKTSGTSARNIDFENISCLGITDCYLELPSTSGYTSAITLVNCTTYNSTATESVRTSASINYTSRGNNWELIYPHTQAVIGDTITINNQNDIFIRVSSSDTTTTPTITSITGGREGQKIFLQCYSPLTSITFTSATAGLSLKTGTTLTIPRGGWIELIKTGSNTWTEINSKSS